MSVQPFREGVEAWYSQYEGESFASARNPYGLGSPQSQLWARGFASAADASVLEFSWEWPVELVDTVADIVRARHDT